MGRVALARATGVVAFFTVLSKVLGFVRETSLAAVFGAGMEVDAYLVAQTIPAIVFSIMSQGLSTTFTPTYLRVREEQGKKSAYALARTVIGTVVVVGVVLVFIGELFAANIVRIVAPGFGPDVAQLATHLSRIIFPMAVFQLVSGVLNGLLQSEGRFGIVSGAALVQNMMIIVSIIAFGSYFGIYAVAVGLLVGAVCSTFIKVPSAMKLGFRLSFRIHWRNPYLQRMIILMVPAIVGTGAGQIDSVVDRILASNLPEGRIAALGYANRLSALAPSIIGVSIMTVVYPALSRRAARKQWDEFSHELIQSLSLTHLALIPIAVGLIILREPIVRIVFERGAFQEEAVVQTAWTLMFLAVGMTYSRMRALVQRGFYAMYDTKTPAVIGVITVLINIALNLLLIGPLEQGGLALATSLTSIIGLVVGLWTFQRKFDIHLDYGRLVASVLRSGLAAVFMGGLIVYGQTWLPADAFVGWTGLIWFGAVVVFGAATYGLFLWLFRVRELNMVMRLIRR